MIIETSRLILRHFEDKDLAEFVRMNSDPQVMEFMIKPLNYDESKEFYNKIQAGYEASYGLSINALEEKSTGEFIGFIALNNPQFSAHFTPCVEIGWRLIKEKWSKGYATEAAKAMIDYGLNELKLKEIVSFTIPANLRSIRIMEKIGMKRDFASDFDHPKVPDGHPAKRHILYRINHIENREIYN